MEKSLTEAIEMVAAALERIARALEGPAEGMPPVVEAGSWIAKDVGEAIQMAASDIAEAIREGGKEQP